MIYALTLNPLVSLWILEIPVSRAVEQRVLILSERPCQCMIPHDRVLSNQKTAAGVGGDETCPMAL